MNLRCGPGLRDTCPDPLNINGVRTTLVRRSFANGPRSRSRCRPQDGNHGGFGTRSRADYLSHSFTGSDGSTLPLFGPCRVPPVGSTAGRASPTSPRAPSWCSLCRTDIRLPRHQRTPPVTLFPLVRRLPLATSSSTRPTDTGGVDQRSYGSPSRTPRGRTDLSSWETHDQCPRVRGRVHLTRGPSPHESFVVTDPWGPS